MQRLAGLLPPMCAERARRARVLYVLYAVCRVPCACYPPVRCPGSPLLLQNHQHLHCLHYTMMSMLIILISVYGLSL